MGAPRVELGIKRLRISCLTIGLRTRMPTPMVWSRRTSSSLSTIQFSGRSSTTGPSTQVPLDSSWIVSGCGRNRTSMSEEPGLRPGEPTTCSTHPRVRSAGIEPATPRWQRGVSPQHFDRFLSSFEPLLGIEPKPAVYETAARPSSRRGLLAAGLLVSVFLLHLRLLPAAHQGVEPCCARFGGEPMRRHP